MEQRKTVGVEHLFNHLIALEYDALGALEAAEHHLHVPRDRAQRDEFVASHLAHLEGLSKMVLAHGGDAATHGDGRELVRKTKVLVASIAGEQAVLVAMKSNADALTTAYARATTDERLKPEERHWLDAARADEQSRSVWLERRLGLTPIVGEEIMAEEGENERARR